MDEATARREKKEARDVTLIGAVLDLLLGVAKIFVGVASNSLALVSDGIHSLSDLLTDGFVLVIAHISRDQPDQEHPYGHGRFETVGTVALGIVLFSTAAIIFYDATRRIVESEITTPGVLALGVALLSIIGKEWIFRYTRNVADRLKSSLLLANAWHSRSDAFSSVAVLIGIGGAILGYPWMDMLAAMVVAVMIGWIGWRFLSRSMKELVDTALPAREVEAIRRYIDSGEGIKGSHAIRSRLHGDKAFLDIHVEVDSRISVSEGHYLAERLSASLQRKFSKVRDVVVHIDPESGSYDNQMINLPGRDTVRRQLLQCWRGELADADIKKLDLHYLNGSIEAEVVISIDKYNNSLCDSIKRKSQEIPWLSRIKIHGSF